jgi:DNA helicase II / ATP-dependent DNA helicase PcrA
VTLLDFKSGEAESDLSMKLDEDEMRLQVSVYGLAARRELEYDPERGLVRYLDEEDPDRRQLSVDLDASTLSQARDTVVHVARDIKDRRFHVGPQRKPRHDGNSVRCQECDFDQFCGLRESATAGGSQV